MKKVLFVVDERMMGGVSIVLQDILKFINTKKYEIDIMVLHNHGDYLNNIDNVNIIYGTPFFEAIDYTIKEVLKSGNIKLILKKCYLVFLMKTGLIKRKIIKERRKCLTKKYDVEIAFKDGFTALFTAFGDSTKKYHWLHADYSTFNPVIKYDKLFKKVFLMFDKIIGVSNNVIKEFLNLYEARETEVIYNIIDAKKIINDSKKEKITYQENKLNLIAIGRLHPLKGYDRLIDVLHKIDLEGKLNNVITRIIGDGGDLERLTELIENYNLEDKVLLLGRKTNPYPYLAKSDMFLMTSYSESFGLVILESLILKVPVLACNIVSIKEIMDKKYGIIVENSSEGLYNGILGVIENQNKLKKYRDNLKDFSYNINDTIKKIETLLDE